MKFRVLLAFGAPIALAAAAAWAAPHPDDGDDASRGLGRQLAELKDGGSYAPNGRGHGYGLLLARGERDADRDATPSGAPGFAGLGTGDSLPPVSTPPASAVPEPTGALLFGAGAGVVALRLRRSR